MIYKVSIIFSKSGGKLRKCGLLFVFGVFFSHLKSACWVIFSCFLLWPAYFFSKLNFFKKCFKSTIRVSHGLAPEQDQHPVGSDLGPNCLQRLSADDKSCRYEGKKEKI